MEKIPALIQNLKFLQNAMAMELKGKETPGNDPKIKPVLRSSLSTLKIIAKRHRVPELSILADNIYANTSPKTRSKWRKRLFFLIGFIVFVSVIFIAAESADLSSMDNDDEEQSEQKRKLKLAIVQMESAIRILKNIKNE